MKEKLEKYRYVILAILVLIAAFYWYEWRPSRIRGKCYAEAEFDKRAWQFNLTDPARNKFIDDYYWGCLKRFGLEK